MPVTQVQKALRTQGLVVVCVFCCFPVLPVPVTQVQKALRTQGLIVVFVFCCFPVLPVEVTQVQKALRTQGLIVVCIFCYYYRSTLPVIIYEASDTNRPLLADSKVNSFDLPAPPPGGYVLAPDLPLVTVSALITGEITTLPL